MNLRPITFLMSAFALVLAPLGVCIGHGAAAASVHASGIHHGTAQAAPDHARHGDRETTHFCPECRPDSFVKAAKNAVPDVAPVKLAIAIPAAPPRVLTVRYARLDHARGLSPRPPPRSRTQRIRLQI